MSSEIILDRADEIRAIAAECETVQEFSNRMGWHIQSAHRANEVLKLNLPILRGSGRSGGVRPAQACPKPQGKGAKAAKGEA